jgi:hypothetical protein
MSRLNFVALVQIGCKRLLLRDESIQCQSPRCFLLIAPGQILSMLVVPHLLR